MTENDTQAERAEEEDPTELCFLNGSTKEEIDVKGSNSGPDFPKETRCGAFGCYPQWMQMLASKKTFLVVFGLLGMNNAAMGSYFVATITTLEKRFKLPSSSTGIISSAWDVGGLVATMFIAYYGSQGHKTRWVASWSSLAALAIIARLIPHLLYGPGDETYKMGENDTALATLLQKEPLCASGYHKQETCSLNDEGTVAYIVTVLAQTMIGVGITAYYTLGSAYLDDNVSKNKFPIMFGLVTCLRFMGQPLGFTLAAAALGTYINTDVKPPFGSDDPRWLGAWHLGWIPLGVLELTFALLLAFFPRTLPREAIRRQNSPLDTKALEKKASQDFFGTVKRLLKNRLLMYITFSHVAYIMGLIGYWYFMPKYIETQFRKSPAEASIITGTVGLVCTSIGILSSGVVTSRFKPRARYLALWNVFTVFLDVIGHFLFVYVGCQKEDLHGSPGSDGSWLLNQTCNNECGCDVTIPYTPVCSEDGTQMFFSPCHAGCFASDFLNGTKMFTNCSCVSGSGIAIAGPCPIDCERQFMIFVALLCFMKFISSTGRTGNTIIQYRSVAPSDKSISIAFAEMLISIFAFIPGPIVYGMVIDSTCKLWGYTCGERGNCLLYVGEQMRYLMNYTASGFLALAVCLDYGVYRSVGSLKIWEDDDTIPTPEMANPSDDIKPPVLIEMKNATKKPLLDKLNAPAKDDDEAD